MREMKDSGVKWINQIPAQWDLQKLKYLTVKCERGTSPDYTDDMATMVVNQATFSKGFFDTANIRYSEKPALTSRGLLHKGDVLLASTGGGVLGKSHYFDEDEIYVADSHVTVIRTREKLCSKYLYYYFYVNFDTFNSQMAVGSTNQIELQRDLLCEMVVPLPAIIEQKKIANFLDAKCAEIDLLISDIHAQIDTLVLYKRSVITEAVTKGLNPHAEMKDSGVVWIGKVPANWRIENPKHHFVQRQERAAKGMVQLTASQKYGVVTQAEYMELTGARVVVVQKDFDILKKVCAGDFVIHMRSFQGGLEYSTKTGSISSAYVMLTPKETISEPRYYKWFFKSSAYIDALSSTSNLVRDGQAMRWANFIQLPIVIPPASEQTEIANFLDSKCAEIDAVIANKMEQLETLDAYKKSLIFEYVTGKKEVFEPVTVVSIDPHVPLLAMVVDMLKKPRGEVVDQKLLYLCDIYLGLGLSTQYYRWDYGPLDLQLYSYIDTLVSNGWYKVDIQNKAKILVKAENHAEALGMYGNQFSQHKSSIEKLIQYFGEMRMGEIERFATLFAVWNDFIIDGIAVPSDGQLIDEVLTNWGPKKGRFSPKTWENTLMKMKRDGIIPKGLGLHTLPKPEGGKSDA